MPDYYTVQPGDSPASVSMKIYGSERMFQELWNANGGAPFRPGMQIILPKKVDNPFISNELAAAVGMETSGQYADWYKSTPNAQTTKYQITPEQAQMNQQWAYDAARGNAGPLEWGRLPSGYTPSSPMGTIPNQQGAIPANRTTPTRTNNYFLQNDANQQRQQDRLIPQKNAAESAPSQKPQPLTFGQQTLGTLGQTFMELLQGKSNAAYPRGLGGPIAQTTPQPQPNTAMYPRGLGGPIISQTDGIMPKPNSAMYPRGLGGPIIQPLETPSPVNKPAVNKGQQELPTERTQTNQTNQTVSPADFAATASGLDWMSIRAGLAVQPPSWYPRYSSGYGGGGSGGGGQSSGISSGYYGLINLRLASG